MNVSMVRMNERQKVVSVTSMHYVELELSFLGRPRVGREAVAVPTGGVAGVQFRQ